MKRKNRDTPGRRIASAIIAEYKPKSVRWQNRTLAPFYPFVDCLFVPIKRDYETKECAVYNILGIRVDGRKEILGLWIQESENKHAWMQIFDELKTRGVQEVGFISMDGVTGHSLKYVPTRERLLRPFEKNLRRTEPQSKPRRIRAFLPGLE